MTTPTAPKTLNEWRGSGAGDLTSHRLVNFVEKDGLLVCEASTDGLKFLKNLPPTLPVVAFSDPKEFETVPGVDEHGISITRRSVDVQESENDCEQLLCLDVTRLVPEHIVLLSKDPMKRAIIGEWEGIFQVLLASVYCIGEENLSKNSQHLAAIAESYFGEE
jgi:hypothetical protein